MQWRSSIGGGGCGRSEGAELEDEAGFDPCCGRCRSTSLLKKNERKKQAAQISVINPDIPSDSGIDSTNKNGSKEDELWFAAICTFQRERTHKHSRTLNKS